MDKTLSKDRKDNVPKLAKSKKPKSSEDTAKKWMKKSKVGGPAPRPIPRQPPSAAAANWNKATNKTVATSRFQNTGRGPPGAAKPGAAKPGATKPGAAKPPPSRPGSSLASSSSSAKPAPSAAKGNWQKAAVKTKATGNFKPAAVGAKKPYVPYKAPAKTASTMKPGMGGKKGGSGKVGGSAKFGGGKMGGRMF